MLAKFLLYLFIIPLGLTLQQKRQVRMLYIKSIEQKKSAVELLEWLSKQSQTPYIIGYSGATKMVMAKHSYNPVVKLRSFNAGKNLLASAIKQDENNVELIFLRYATQSETPSFLGYKDNLVEDRAFILRNLKRIKGDEELLNTVTSYMRKQKLSWAEQQQLKTGQQ